MRTFTLIIKMITFQLSLLALKWNDMSHGNVEFILKWRATEFVCKSFAGAFIISVDRNLISLNHCFWHDAIKWFNLCNTFQICLHCTNFTSSDKVHTKKSPINRPKYTHFFSIQIHKAKREDRSITNKHKFWLSCIESIFIICRFDDPQSILQNKMDFYDRFCNTLELIAIEWRWWRFGDTMIWHFIILYHHFSCSV